MLCVHCKGVYGSIPHAKFPFSSEFSIELLLIKQYFSFNRKINKIESSIGYVYLFGIKTLIQTDKSTNLNSVLNLFRKAELSKYVESMMGRVPVCSISTNQVNF